MNYLAIIYAILPVYLVLALGIVLRRAGRVSDEVQNGMMRLVITVFYPAMVFARLSGNAVLADYQQVALMAGLGFLLLVASFAICGAGGWLLGLRRGTGLRTFTLATGLQNYGYVAIPLTTALFHAHPGTDAMLFVFMLGVEVGVWTVGVTLLTGLTRDNLRHVLNPIVISILVSLFLTYSGLHAWVPSYVVTAIRQLGDCSLPLSVLLVGAGMADFFGRERISWRVGLGSVLLRSTAIPLLYFLAAWALPLSLEAQRVLLVQCAVPAAIFPVVLARMHGGHPGTAVQVIIATAASSFFTMPALIKWGLDWMAR